MYKKNKTHYPTFKKKAWFNKQKIFIDSKLIHKAYKMYKCVIMYNLKTIINEFSYFPSF